MRELALLVTHLYPVGRESRFPLVIVPQVTISVTTRGTGQGWLPQGRAFVVVDGKHTKITEGRFVVIVALFGTKYGDI